MDATGGRVGRQWIRLHLHCDSNIQKFDASSTGESQLSPVASSELLGVIVGDKLFDFPLNLRVGVLGQILVPFPFQQRAQAVRNLFPELP